MKIRILIIALVAALVCACSSSSPEAIDERLGMAASEVTNGDATQAKSLCDEILAINTLSATQLAQLSLLYMQLSDRDDVEDNTAIAYQCYRNAFKADADSAAAFYQNVGPSDVRYVQMLTVLAQQMDNPDKLFIPDHEEPSDSLAR